ncbi:MAG TPA: DHA2 family efflux MFS transporter permease subunit [Pirellulales bacterium]|nr:DHA2 family efflux MFS transporter permease subunit [Pirellulales bacterium]
MSTLTINGPRLLPAGRPSLLANHWVIALTVTMATFMEVLDTSIANVSLPHIAGNLSVSTNESTWVLTSYLVANAIVLPLSGWLSAILGRKRFYMICVLMFTISSMLCGLASGLGQLIFFRVLQGMGGGGLQPSEQAILVDTFPPQKRGMAMAVYGMAILVAPVLGPTLGGWITDNYSWRWIFFINAPVGCASLLLSSIVLRDPPHLIEKRAELRKKKFQVDYIGLSLIALGLGTLEIVLDKGQDADWFGSRMIVCLSVVAVVSLVAAVVWELKHPQPIVNLRLLKERNFRFCALVLFFAFGVLYGSTVLLPELMQLLMGYSATMAGLVMSPAGLFTMLEMPLIGFLLGRRVDARWLIMSGLAIVGFAAYWMSTLNLEVGPYQLIVPRIVQTLGAGMLWVPGNTAAYMYIPRDQTSNASGLFNLIRNEGSSIGVSVVTTLLVRNSQAHQTFLAAHVNRLNPTATAALHHATATVLARTGDPVLSQKMGLAMIYSEVQRQAMALSYFDMFRLFSLASFIVIPLVLLMKRSVAEKGATAAH